MTFTPGNMPQRRPDYRNLRAERTVEDGGADRYRLAGHAAQQATAKGFDHADVLAAANDPHTTYANGRYPDQMRHIRGNIVAVVHPQSAKIVTVYENVKQTDLRPDQTDHDAQRYNARRLGS